MFCQDITLVITRLIICGIVVAFFSRRQCAATDAKQAIRRAVSPEPICETPLSGPTTQAISIRRPANIAAFSPMHRVACTQYAAAGDFQERPRSLRPRWRSNRTRRCFAWGTPKRRCDGRFFACGGSGSEVPERRMGSLSRSRKPIRFLDARFSR